MNNSSKVSSKKACAPFRHPNDLASCIALVEALYELPESREVVLDRFRELKRAKEAARSELKRLPSKERDRIIRKQRSAAGLQRAEEMWKKEQPVDRPVLPKDRDSILTIARKALSEGGFMEVAVLRVVTRDRKEGYVRPERRTADQNKAMSERAVENARTAGSSKKTVTGRFREAVMANMRKAVQTLIATKATSKMISYGGETHDIKEWSKIRGLSYTAMRNRIRLYPVEIALSPEFESLAKGFRSVHGKNTSRRGSRKGVAK